jgi:hypothetical protein
LETVLAREFRDAQRATRRYFRAVGKERRRLERLIARNEAFLENHPMQEPLDGASPERRAWASLIRKSRLSKRDRYSNQPVTVCESWKQDFLRFFFDVAPRPVGYYLSRPDPAKPYSATNFCWITTSQIPLRKRPRNSKLTTINGELRSISGLAKQLDLDYPALHARLIRRRQPPEQAIEALQRRDFVCRCPTHSGSVQSSDVSNFNERGGPDDVG